MVEGMVVASIDGVHSRLARCCYPVPREEIVGYVTRGHGATIHLAKLPEHHVGRTANAWCRPVGATPTIEPTQ